MKNTGISLQEYQNAADTLRCEVAAIMAVDTVESRGAGFLPDGKIKILFEPHIFWKRLKKYGINPIPLQSGNSDILYPTWQQGKYGPVDLQHAKLDRSIAIHKQAAMEACSWGRYQIMGFNYAECGYGNVIDFVDSMSENEGSHLMNFVAYIQHTHLDDELRAKHWPAFAECYNGPDYKRNSYDTKLQKAYDSAIAKMIV